MFRDEATRELRNATAAKTLSRNKLRKKEEIILILIFFKGDEGERREHECIKQNGNNKMCAFSQPDCFSCDPDWRLQYPRNFLNLHIPPDPVLPAKTAHILSDSQANKKLKLSMLLNGVLTLSFLQPRKERDFN